jgi:hypothetical protein
MSTPTPEQIAAAIRDPESGLYPAQIGVVCDRCGITVTRDYLVHENMDQQQRFGVARKHLRDSEGRSCDEDGDTCAGCLAEMRAKGEEFV